MTSSLEKIIHSALKSKEVIETVLIQELWSGYGELTRITTDKGAVICKLIEFPKESNHPRGWATNIGHQRKVKSYKVEKNWYGSLSIVPGARMAKCLSQGELEGREYLILEDLNESGFTPRSSVSFNEVKKCLTWLAHFHKHFMNKAPEGLWEVGTYWHLDTRPEEFKVMEEDELKQAASFIDKKLNEASYQTIVHGDAKLSNFLFNDTEAAAVDFQYVGGGVGIKDVAYFLSSVYEEKDLFNVEEKCLETYFKILDLPDVEREWRALYPVAWSDFYRFLKGWSPGHRKINSYSQSMVNKALKCI